MPRKKPNGYWTKENCRLEALKYNLKSDFEVFASGAFLVAKKNGWLLDLCQHMTEGRKCNDYWDYERCEKEASKFKTKAEFKQFFPYAYKKARESGWLNKICSHMNIIKLLNNHWDDYEHCRSEALKYDSRSVFQKSCSGAYKAAVRNGWIDVVCSHMKIQGNRCNRLIYSYEFPDNHVYVGLTYNLKTRDNEHRTKRSAVLEHSLRTSLEIPTAIIKRDFHPIDIAIKLEGEVLDEYVNNGWYILNKIKTGGLGGTVRKSN